MYYKLSYNGYGVVISERRMVLSHRKLPRTTQQIEKALHSAREPYYRGDGVLYLNRVRARITRREVMTENLILDFGGESQNIVCV